MTPEPIPMSEADRAATRRVCDALDRLFARRKPRPLPALLSVPVRRRDGRVLVGDDSYTTAQASELAARVARHARLALSLGREKAEGDFPGLTPIEALELAERVFREAIRCDLCRHAPTPEEPEETDLEGEGARLDEVRVRIAEE